MTKNRSPILRFFLRLLAVLLVTLLVALGFVYGVMVLLCRGPSPTAKELFVLSTRETSAIGFLPRLCLSAEEIDEILSRQEAQITESTDVSLITLPQQAPEDKSAADAWGYTDEDGDGLILVPVTGESFTGHMLIVLDPSRVVLGFSPKDLGVRGYTVAEFAEKYKEDGILWFFEDCELTPMAVRRTLWAMKHTGWFKHVKGFLIGRPMNEDEVIFGLGHEEAVISVLKECGVPIAYGLDFGHLPPHMPIVCGAVAEAEGNGKTFRITYDFR